MMPLSISVAGCDSDLLLRIPPFIASVPALRSAMISSPQRRSARTFRRPPFAPRRLA